MRRKIEMNPIPINHDAYSTLVALRMRQQIKWNPIPMQVYIDHDAYSRAPTQDATTDRIEFNGHKSLHQVLTPTFVLPKDTTTDRIDSKPHTSKHRILTPRVNPIKRIQRPEQSTSNTWRITTSPAISTPPLGIYHIIAVELRLLCFSKSRPCSNLLPKCIRMG